MIGLAVCGVIEFSDCVWFQVCTDLFSLTLFISFQLVVVLFQTENKNENKK